MSYPVEFRRSGQQQQCLVDNVDTSTRTGTAPAFTRHRRNSSELRAALW